MQRIRSRFVGAAAALVLAAASGALPVAAAPTPGAPGWTPTGFLAQARASHTATLLPGGKVLAVGGHAGSTTFSSCEIFNPVTGAWSPTGALTTGPRQDHGAVLLPGGKVLVAGGYDYGSASSASTAELYDPSTGTWSATGSMSIGRQGPALTLLPGGKVLAAGGHDAAAGFLGSSEIYDPSTGTWSATGSMATARGGHTATLLNDGRVLVTGGVGGAVLDSCEVYNPATGAWSTAAPMPFGARFNHTATLLPSGKVLAAGGNLNGDRAECAIFDPAAGTWSNTGSLSTARDAHAATLLPTGKVLVTGGALGGPGLDTAPLSSCEIYDPAAGSWSSAPSLTTGGRWAHPATTLGDGRVLVAGGYQYGPSTAACEIFDSGVAAGTTPPAGTWTAKAPLNTPRSGHGVCAYNGKVYVVGGIAGSSLNNLEVYDPITNAWTVKAPMPTARFGVGFAATGGLLYAIGGDAGSTVATVEAYDPALNTWTTKASMQVARYFPAVDVVNGKIYACGGAGGVTTMEEYDPGSNTWTLRQAMPTAKAYAGKTVLGGQMYVLGGTDATSDVSTVVAYDPVANAWAAKAPMPGPMQTPITGVLGGEIYAVGGYTGGAFFNTTRIYTPGSDSWRTGRPMPTARGYAAGTVLDGILYVIGGDTAIGGTRTGAVEAFTPPSIGVWTTKASMPTARISLATAALNGKLYAVGGDLVGASASVLEVYDPATNAWTTKAPMPTAREDLDFVETGGILYAIGGINSGSIPLATVEAYDPATGTWLAKASLPTPRYASMAATAGGKIFVCGGIADGSLASTVVIYDPATNTWTSGPSMPRAVFAGGAAAVDGILYVLGHTGTEAGPFPLMSLNPVAGSWSTLSSLPTTRWNLGMGAVDGEIYFVGGYSGPSYATVDIYNPATATWRTGPAMNARRSSLGVAVLGGAIYAVGGIDLQPGAPVTPQGLLATMEALEVGFNGVHIPADIVKESDEAGGGATVNFIVSLASSPSATAVLTVTDLTGGRTLLSAPAAAGDHGVGSVVFPVGSSTIEVRVTDGTQVLYSNSFTVQVADTTPPVLAGVEAKTVECLGHATPITPEMLGITATDSADPHPTMALAPSMLELGANTVTATARDASGNTVSSDFVVTVVDTHAPFFTVLPADVSRPCEGANGSTVAFDIRAEDLCGEVTIVSVDETGRTVDPAGSTYAIGVHTVTCTATDSSLNAATCSFKVTIVDDDAPVLVCPGDITAPTDPGRSTAAVAFSVTATDACDTQVSITCTALGGEVHSGDAFPLGLTTVTSIARDRSGNEATGSFRILVVDREAPVVTAPATVSLVTDCAGSRLAITPALLGVTALDNADPAPRLACSPASLRPGTTSVDCTATDAAGNAAHASVSVTVLRGPFAWQFLRPLDSKVDNLIQPGRTIPLKLRVTCNNAVERDATVTLDHVTQIDSTGTPIANVPFARDEDNRCGDHEGDDHEGSRFEFDDGRYQFELRTKGFATTSGARFRVVMKIAEAGHADTFAEVVLRNR